MATKTLSDIVIKHICERPDGGPGQLDAPETIVTTVHELHEAIEFALQTIRIDLEGITGSIHRGDYRERFLDILKSLE